MNAASYVNNIQQAPTPSQVPPPVKQPVTTPQDTVALSSAAQAAAENK